MSGSPSRRKGPISVDQFVESPSPSEDEIDGAEPHHEDKNYSGFLDYLREHKCPVCSLPSRDPLLPCESCRQAMMASSFDECEEGCDMSNQDDRSYQGEEPHFEDPVASTNEQGTYYDTPSVVSNGAEEEVEEEDSIEEDDEELGYHHITNNSLYPTFSSNGKFMRYEVNNEAGESFLWDNNPEDQDPTNEDSTRRSMKYSSLKYRYEIVMILPLLLAAIVASALYFPTRGSKPSQSAASSFDSATYDYVDQVISADEPTATNKEHTHPQMNHSHTRNTPAPTPAPVKDHSVKHTHTHEQKDHPKRNPALSEDDSPDTHEQKDHPERNPELPEDDSPEEERPIKAADVHHLEAVAVSTVKKSKPEYKWGGLQEMGIERDERVSFMRFDLSSVSSNAITKATLKLYLKTLNSVNQEAMVVDVDLLHQSGNWEDQSVSWNNPLVSQESFSVASFEAVPLLVLGDTKQFIEVDVTSAISTAKYGDESVTFKLSTESDGDLYIASKAWNGGEAVPELVVTLAV